ncbi:MAG: MFS transporter [Terrisporobacter sp.]
MKKLNRWVYVVVGTIVLLFAGLIYAWSVLASPIAEEFTSWSNAQLSLTFTIGMTMFCLGGLVGGLCANKINVKINVWVSATLFLIGFYLASKTTTLLGLYIGFGVLGGFASGLAYNAVMSTMCKWFPDKQGLVSGILLMGFGIGSFITGKVYQAYTPAEIGGWRTSFLVFGIVLFIVLFIGGFFFVKPGEDFVHPDGSRNTRNKKKFECGIDVNASVMIKRPAFWLFFSWAILLSGAGLSLISQAKGVAIEIGSQVDGGTIATVVGLISIFNGIGRVVYGGMFDKVGRAKTMFTINMVFILSVGVLIVAFITKSFALIVLGFMCCGFSYGGIPTTSSAFVNAFYGPTHYPVNFSIINLSLIFASFGSTISGALYDSSGSYLSTFIVMIGATIVGLICFFGIKKP